MSVDDGSGSQTHHDQPGGRPAADSAGDSAHAASDAQSGERATGERDPANDPTSAGATHANTNAANANAESAQAADALAAFIDASPSPYHAVANAARLLQQEGFRQVRESESWTAVPQQGYVVREGSLAAWDLRGWDGSTGLRIIGAHTDSPNLRVRPNPDRRRFGWDQLAVDVYGGPLLTSWLDRDLGLSGRVTVRGNDHGFDVRLVKVDEPLLRVPHLAIHLDRGANEGLAVNPQNHLVPVWGATGSAPDFTAYLAGLLDVPQRDVLGWDLMTHDLTPVRRLGHHQDLLAAPRLDNLASSYASLAALIGTTSAPRTPQAGRLVVLFDHEEIGSVTNRGGDSQFLPSLIERLVTSTTPQATRDDVLRVYATSVIASADMAHAIHPNYPERYETDHLALIGGGPVLKINAKGRYATDATGTAYAALAAEQAGTGLQRFVVRGDMPCGSTIGPMSSALVGAVTFDIGAPMLSMHSVRELMGVADVSAYVDFLTAFLAPA